MYEFTHFAHKSGRQFSRLNSFTFVISELLKDDYKVRVLLIVVCIQKLLIGLIRPHLLLYSVILYCFVFAFGNIFCKLSFHLIFFHKLKLQKRVGNQYFFFFKYLKLQNLAKYGKLLHRPIPTSQITSRSKFDFE